MNDLTIRPRLSLGYGSIGHLLAPLSIARGIPFQAVRRSATVNKQTGVSLICGDVTKPEFLERLLKDTPTDIVVTLTPDNYSEQGYRDAYLACAEALADVIPKVSPQSRIVYVSSTSVYPQNAGECVNEETDCRLPHQRSQLSPTARVLQDTEEVIASIGIPYCNLRFSGIYGPGRTRLIQSVREGKLAPQAPTQWTNRIHAEDCAGIIDFLLQLSTLPPCVIGTDNCSASKHEVHQYVAHLLGSSHTSSPNTAANKSQTETNEQQNNHERGKRCSNALLSQLGYPYRYPDYKAGFKALLSDPV